MVMQSYNVSDGSGTAIWEGVYRTSEACLDFTERVNSTEHKDNSFLSDRWNRKLLDMYRVAKAGRFPRASTLPEFSHAVNPDQIFDFGGGSGWTWELLPTSQKQSHFKYTVIELQGIVEAMKSHPEISKEIRFLSVDELSNELTSNSCLLYSNSVL